MAESAHDLGIVGELVAAPRRGGTDSPIELKGETEREIIGLAIPERASNPLFPE
jgi:hypothetical protein